MTTPISPTHRRLAEVALSTSYVDTPEAIEIAAQALADEMGPIERRYTSTWAGAAFENITPAIAILVFKEPSPPDPTGGRDG